MVDDYKNRDPYNPSPTGMGPGAYDQYGNARFDPVDEGGRGPYILLGILVAIGVIGGLLYFNHAPTDRNAQQAQAPSVTDTRPAPTTPAAPGAAPLAPAMPRTGPSSDTGAATPPARQ